MAHALQNVLPLSMSSCVGPRYTGRDIRHGSKDRKTQENLKEREEKYVKIYESSMIL